MRDKPDSNPRGVSKAEGPVAIDDSGRGPQRPSARRRLKRSRRKLKRFWREQCVPGEWKHRSVALEEQTSPVYRYVTVTIYVVVMLLLIIAGLWVLGHTVFRVVSESGSNFSHLLPDALGGLILAVIVL